MNAGADTRAAPADDGQRHERRGELTRVDGPDPQGRRRQYRLPAGASSCCRRSASGTPPSWLETNEGSEGSSDPIPNGLVQGRDLLSAAKDGYVYRSRSDGHMTLLKREKELLLRIRLAYVDSPEMREVATNLPSHTGLE